MFSSNNNRNNSLWSQRIYTKKNQNQCAQRIRTLSKGYFCTGLPRCQSFQTFSWRDSVADVTGPVWSLSSLLSTQNPGTWIHLDLGLRVLSALHLSSPGPARKSHLCRVKKPLWKNVHGCAVLCWDLCVVFKFPSGGEARSTVKSSSGKDVLSPGRTTSPSPEQGGHWRWARKSRNCLLMLTPRPEVADRISFSPFLWPLWITCSIVDWTLF